MNIQHKIIGFNKDILQVSVNFYCDEVPEGLTYAVDIPQNIISDAAAITAHIQSFTPTGQLERIAELRAITVDTSVIEAMVVVPVEQPAPVEVPAP